MNLTNCLTDRLDVSEWDAGKYSVFIRFDAVAASSLSPHRELQMSVGDSNPAKSPAR